MKRLICPLLLALVGLAGCGPSSAPTANPTKASEVKPHSHTMIGPTGGPLVEWGDDEYHAELVFEAEKSSLTVHVLDGQAKKLVPTDAKSLTLTLQGTPPVVISLTPKPMEGDPVGQSTRFVVTHAVLKTPKNWKGSLSGSVNGKNYTGDFEQKAEKPK